MIQEFYTASSASLCFHNFDLNKVRQLHGYGPGFAGYGLVRRCYHR